MSCYRPYKAFVGGDGRVNFSGPGRPLSLPCGKCLGCQMRRAEMWSVRIMHEAQMHDRNCFITLTYDDEHLPKDGGLHVEDFQKFCKRLRKAIGAFRFFHCGEYGERGGRPHFHACLFGWDFASDRVLLRRSGENSLYSSRVLEKAWQKGYSSVGDLSYASASYVARYVVGKCDKRRVRRYTDPVTGEVHDLRSEYVTMSRKPGIGSTWFDKFMDDVFPSDEVVHRGRKYSVPRYYFDKLSRELPSLASSLKAKRLEAMSERAEDNTEERLRVREQVAEARLSLLSRDVL